MLIRRRCWLGSRAVVSAELPVNMDNSALVDSIWVTSARMQLDLRTKRLSITSARIPPCGQRGRGVDRSLAGGWIEVA
jgi:hypothetical protein